MNAVHLFELLIAMLFAVIALHYLAHRLRLPPAVALIAGGAALAFIPGLPEISLDPALVLVIFLPPLLMDGAWFIPLRHLRRHLIGILSLAIGAVVFTTAVVAVVTHALLPSLPWAACAALGAIVSPPDAIAARVDDRAVHAREARRLLECESGRGRDRTLFGEVVNRRDLVRRERLVGQAGDGQHPEHPQAVD